MKRRWPSVVGLALVAAGCGGTLDAGYDVPHGLLPVDERNPVILYQDDWSGDWLGEYAVLLANGGGPPLAGIVINTSPFWMDLKANTSGWNNLLTAARESGLKNIPEDVTASAGGPLTRPPDGDIEATVANDSAGAEVMVAVSRRLSTPTRPVVVVTTTSFTDLANAYFLDRTIVDRVVVVAAAGSYQAPNGILNGPNGDMDPWADWIVTQRFRFVHVGTWYDQTGDVTQAEISSLPQNAFGAWIADKQSKIIAITTASDQVGLLSFALPMFTTAVQRASPDTSSGFDSAQGPNLVPNTDGNAWLVTQIAAPLAASRLWELLLNRATFGS
jgi:hypothetical protein